MGIFDSWKRKNEINDKKSEVSDSSCSGDCEGVEIYYFTYPELG